MKAAAAGPGVLIQPSVNFDPGPDLVGSSIKNHFRSNGSELPRVLRKSSSSGANSIRFSARGFLQRTGTFGEAVLGFLGFWGGAIWNLGVYGLIPRLMNCGSSLKKGEQKKKKPYQESRFVP